MKVIAVVGRNGSGKTLYIERLRRLMASDKVRYIAFTDSYGVNVDGQYYLQLRWNQHDIDHETPTVGELLQRAYLLAGEDTEERRQLKEHLYELLTPHGHRQAEQYGGCHNGCMSPQSSRPPRGQSLPCPMP